MLEIESTDQHGRMTIRSGQNVFEVEKINCHYLETNPDTAMFTGQVND